MFKLSRETCNKLETAESKQWLVTNGIGGYASGTVAGNLTSRYHGLLIAALAPPLGRTLLVSKFDEIVHYDGHDYALGVNRWGSGAVDPLGYLYLESFHLDGAIPVWCYACADAMIEKRIWMEQGENITHMQYHLRRGSQPISLSIKVLVNYRDHHSETRAGDKKFEIVDVHNGIRIKASDNAVPFYVLSDNASVVPTHEWYHNFFLPIEAGRGLNAIEDHLCAGIFRATLHAGEPLTMTLSTTPEPASALRGEAAYARRKKYEEGLLAHADANNVSHRQLLLAADQFIVKRSDGDTVIAGYPWFGDWGRDTMIALNGLTLATQRFDSAKSILKTFAQFVDQGMLPNRFPDEGERPEYNTVDATLWYFEAIRAYYAATNDEELLRELFPVLEDIVAWHRRGTRYNIHVTDDGLLYSGETGVQLTWMDAKVGDWVVTPRTGKAVEINALWYNALCVMRDFAKILKCDDVYSALAEKTQESFKKFWGDGYCFDVIDAPEGNDASLRPNQLLAVSLPYSPLSASQRKSVVDVCARRLLASHGLRSLSPDHPSYIGRYHGDQHQRDAAYHQGTVWAWLIGPFVSAHWRVYRDAKMARSFLEPLLDHLGEHCVGSISEIFEGDEPFDARGCIAQAWSVAEVLRVMKELEIKD